MIHVVKVTTACYILKMTSVTFIVRLQRYEKLYELIMVLFDDTYLKGNLMTLWYFEYNDINTHHAYSVYHSLTGIYIKKIHTLQSIVVIV